MRLASLKYPDLKKSASKVSCRPSFGFRSPLVTPVFRPSLDGLISKSTDLQHLFRVPVPLLPYAEFPSSERMPVLVGGPGSIGGVVVMNAQVVQVQASGARGIKVTR